ncbi:non-homologous end-joining DNA ligase [Actinomycetospora chibensis]|uniref:Non-homologous end-joining DNA ligase n=1 Tax=Actinomycetospora chibensis TaxID=663606 RepID=A0ABV9RJP1_9PSEU|nr:non-homologous end-joining DNA ligase [Actinomycetospora chibensis]MDD7926876.1 non-homologous end-joining DNA ligase [Actinomycetospora chibensis]
MAATGSRGRGSDSTGEERDGVALTNLDQELFTGAGVTKRELVDYLDAMAPRLLPALAGRPLSVVRALRGQKPFMQKNVPKYTPDFVRTVSFWAESSHREVAYALCDDRPTLLWFANQRAIEYHPTLTRADAMGMPEHLVLDLDPPEDAGFDAVVAAAHLVRRALDDVGLAGVVKTTGSKGVHILVPLAPGPTHEDVAGATRALAVRTERLDPTVATTAFIRADRDGKVFVDPTRAGGSTIAAVYSPRVRPGLPVSFPVTWDELDTVVPSEITVRTAPDRPDPWSDATSRPAAQALPEELVAEGRTIPVARVQAMHEGKRRKRAAEKTDEG